MSVRTNSRQITCVFSAVFSVLVLAGLTACGSGQRNITLDASPTEVAQVRSIAIASVTGRPSETHEILPLARGNMVRVLTKFENELFEYLLLRGFNVVNPAVSRVAYTRETDYEDLYIANDPTILTNVQSGAEFKFLANNMKKLAMQHTQKPAGTFTSNNYQPSQYNLMPSIDRTPTVNIDQPDILSSANTRVFEQLEFGTNLSTPSMTILGGADDNRWANQPMRRAIGEVTHRMGADAYLIVDAHLRLSPREEGPVLAGALGGGTRSVICEGTAMLVRNDGSILSVESFHAASDDHVSGGEGSGSRPRTFSGLAHFEGNASNLNDMTMQAVRNAADMIANTYQGYVKKYGAGTEGGFAERIFN
ncbi:MAG: hypothetical protein K2Q32_01050 [Alphaproteobacteria bacterium]|nr:hypothetical protein [Alphaproteobacteria bacterium]